MNLDTKEQDIEGVATEQRKDTSDQQQRKRWYTRFFSPLWVCLLIALALRVWLIVHTHGVIDGDEALVGIQAERILHGDFPVYFYGIPYFGSIEAYLVALVFVITGPSVWALRTEPLLISLLLVWLIWKFAHALADIAHLPPYARTSFTSIAILVAAVPPLYDGVIELRTFGGYIETFVLILLLLLATLQLTRRWHSGASSRELAWRWAAIGFIVGLGFWGYPLIATAVLAKCAHRNGQAVPASTCWYKAICYYNCEPSKGITLCCSRHSNGYSWFYSCAHLGSYSSMGKHYVYHPPRWHRKYTESAQYDTPCDKSLRYLRRTHGH